MISERGAAPNLVVVDAQWSVLIISATDIWHAAGIDVALGRTLPAALQAIVLAALPADPRTEARHAVVSPWPNVALTVHTAQGASGSLIALSAQPIGAREMLRRAQLVYGLSRRELEILWHILSGAGTSQIALTLNIADSTVIAHVKSLMAKTRAANRAALVARVLGWEETLA